MLNKIEKLEISSGNNFVGKPILQKFRTRSRIVAFLCTVRAIYA